jgi:hypothetical protein
MSTFLPSEKGMTIRQPSVANLMIDSRKTTLGASNPANILITRPNSIMNGFFTRIATTEVVLEWATPNVSTDSSNNFVQILFTGAGAPSPALQQFYVPPAFYNVEQALKAIVATANAIPAISGSGTFSVTGSNGIAAIAFSNAAVGFTFAGPLATRLNIAGITIAGGGTLILTQAGGVGSPSPSAPDLRLYRYLDFVSAQLTYNQDLKDGTDFINRDVLCRWYMAYDEAPLLDGFGFPILMGYNNFCLRRLFNPPKQIRWDNIQPIGQLSFQIYPDFGFSIAPLSNSTNWLMTLQVSEV